MCEIGKLIISGELKDGDSVRIDAKDEELDITHKTVVLALCHPETE